MNKLLRNQMRDLRWRRRLARVKATERTYAPIDGERPQFCYRDQSTPCSCWLCDRQKGGELSHSTRKRMMV